MQQTVLKLENISKLFPGVKALDSISFEARSGEILGLIGVNGAGKSTLMNILGGVFPASEGRILIDDVEINLHNPQDAEKNGIGFIHQEPTLFNSLSVAENVVLSRMKGRIQYKKIRAEAKLHLGKMGSSINPATIVGTLPIGDRQMIEIARALSAGGKILLFDEPTASFAAREKDKLFEVIRELKRQGSIIIFISHFLDEVEELCDRIVVLRDGRVALSGNMSEISRSMILQNMIGGELDKVDLNKQHEQGEVVFRVGNISAGNAPENVSLELHKGEIVGVWGLMGSGRTELLRAIYGLDKVDSGKIQIRLPGGEMKDISFDKVRDYCGYVTENRHEDGVFLPWTIWENIAAPNLKRFVRKPIPFLDFRRQRQDAFEFVKRLNIKTPSVDARVEQLSGGNQQKVIIAKWLMRKPAVFFLDEPTRGVDVGAKAEIHRLIHDLAGEGTAVLLVSSEIEEISELSDRVLVLNRGRIVAQVNKSEIDKEVLMSKCV